jgi:tRNA-splicing ligase RtcB (3'-phosphate/5'-hydroxy nucleic acid ligase)
MFEKLFYRVFLISLKKYQNVYILLFLLFFMLKKKLKKIGKYEYELPKSGRMLVSGRLFMSEKLIETVEEDTLNQIANVASLPGILKYSIGLADMHVGYGFPIGGVAAFDLDKGIISPGGVGYDINCSIRLLKTNLTKRDISKKQKEIAEIFYKKIPSGVGRGSKFQIIYKELDKLLEGGAKYLIERGYGIKDDYLHTEEEGCMENADASKVSDRAKKRGIGQLGTIGAGNHFFEILYVDEIFDEKVAEVFGLRKEQIVVLIHCGSRGLGHQIASDYIRLMEQKYGFKNLSDRELIYAPIKSELGKNYFSAMAAAANFSFANKQLITYWTREEMKKIFPNSKVEVLYDVCHNIAKFEEYIIEGKKKKVCVHRKGATRSFGPGRKEVPEEYRKVGQPVLIPGSMGTSSYVLVGTKKAEELTFGSTVHGAGRVLSRTRAIKNLSVKEVKKNLEKKGIEIRFGSSKSLIQESPEVYKNVDEVVKTMSDLGISKKVAKLKPLIVIIG